MEVTVTQEDIDTAIELCKTKDIVMNCAISIALNRITGKIWGTGCSSAAESDITGDPIPGGLLLGFPEEIYRWISNFDTKRPVSPITFTAWESRA